MSDHTTALVPIESWAYGSPELRAAGRAIDVGLFLEALIYYERVLLNVTNSQQFAELLGWLVQSGGLDVFLSLVREGVITFYDYSFLTAPVLKDGAYSLWNMQDPVQAQYGTFPRRFLYTRNVEAVLQNARRRKRLYDAFRDRVIEAKSDDFGIAIENARRDYEDPRRVAVLVQAFVDEVYEIRHLGRPPQVTATLSPKADGSGVIITWNVDFDHLSALAGPGVGFDGHSPLTGGALCNRYLLSALQRRCDLYLGRPMSALAGDKLYESSRTPAKSGQVLASLKERVEFPDIRALVNEGKMSLTDVLAIRAKAERFRRWLQMEADRDRDALIAYHQEVARESGLTRYSRKTLNVFGVLGGGALGGAIGGAVAGPIGGAVGNAAGSALTLLLDIGSKLGADWKPVIFGTWLRDHIARFVESDEASRR